MFSVFTQPAVHLVQNAGQETKPIDYHVNNYKSSHSQATFKPNYRMYRVQNAAIDIIE